MNDSKPQLAVESGPHTKSLWSLWQSWDASVWSLVIANVIPLFGALFLGWDTASILFIYWSENLVIGFYNALKMVTARRKGMNDSKLFLVPFFCVHFGGFCFGHGIFLVVFTNMGEGGGLGSVDPFPNAFDWPGPLIFVGVMWGVLSTVFGKYGHAITVPIIAMLISHGISFRNNYIGKGEYLKRSPGDQMMAPYSRIMIMHVAIIAAGVPVMFLGSPLPLLIILIAGKTFIDIGLHSKSHRKGMFGARSA